VKVFLSQLGHFVLLFVLRRAFVDWYLTLVYAHRTVPIQRRVIAVPVCVVRLTFIMRCCPARALLERVMQRFSTSGLGSCDAHYKAVRKAVAAIIHIDCFYTFQGLLVIMPVLRWSVMSYGTVCVSFHLVSGQSHPSTSAASSDY